MNFIFWRTNCASAKLAMPVAVYYCLPNRALQINPGKKATHASCIAQKASQNTFDALYGE